MRLFYESGVLGANLTPEEIRQLPEFREIVKYHILPGEWTSGFFLDGIDIQTSLPDAQLTILRDADGGGHVSFGSTCSKTNRRREDCPCDGPCGKIIEPDVYASNGVLHVIDSVLLPPSIAQEYLPDQDVDELLMELVEDYDDPAMEDEP